MKQRKPIHPKQPEASAPIEHSPRKKAFFWGVMLFLPLFMLVVLELALRLVDYGGTIEVVKTKTLGGTMYYTLNSDIGRRYFTNRTTGIPEVYDDVFTMKKGPRTKRIFMLGESTMAGWPFDYNATPSRLLQDRLRKLLPEDTIEVINVGLSATNSYTVRDLIAELADYQPDAFIVYLAHNEFYGAFGVGSTEYLGKWRSAVNLYLNLRNFKTFLLLRDGVFWVRNAISPPAAQRRSTLMEAMVGNDRIPINSPEYAIARANFEANYRDIVHIAKDRGIPIILSTVASNIRDQRPLMAGFSETTPADQQSAWDLYWKRGMEGMSQGHFGAAETEFRKCVGIDSLHAAGYFALAQALDSLRRYEEAKTAYVRARDLDNMRFRASTEFNEIIRALGRTEGVPVADAERAFEAQSPHGLVGTNFMLEHLHPNFDGYILLAKVFCESAAEHGVLAPTSEWRWERNLTEDQYKAAAGVTPLDLEAARFKVHNLVHNWPFTDRVEGSTFPSPQNRVQEIALKYVQDRIAWSDAHFQLAEWHKENERYAEAMAECYAVAKVAFFSYYPWMQMGDIARLMERPDSAETLYRRGLQIEDTPFLHVRLGMLYFDLEQTTDAIREFEATFTANTTAGNPLDGKQLSTARFFLGAAYGKSGDVTKAKSNLQLAVQIDPGNIEAKNMLARIH